MHNNISRLEQDFEQCQIPGIHFKYFSECRDTIFGTCCHKEFINLCIHKYLEKNLRANSGYQVFSQYFFRYSLKNNEDMLAFSQKISHYECECENFIYELFS